MSRRRKSRIIEITNNKLQFPNNFQWKKKNNKYDLEERTFYFGSNLINLCKKIKIDYLNQNIITQVLRSGTSLGANYREANETETKKDFLYRMRICRKESKETIYWLSLLKETNSNLKSEIINLLDEVNQLKKIFAAIIEKSKM